MTMAVFTIVKNEDFFLPWWLKHYKKLFKTEDIYILNNGDPIDVDVAVAEVTHPREKSFDHAWLRDTVCGYQAELLQSYDWVLFAEADELLIGSPGTEVAATLKHIETYGADGHATVQMMSRDFVHNPFLEPEIDTEKPIIGTQRNWWMHRMCMDKATLTSKPVMYSLGFHGCPKEARPDYITCMQLYIAHMHRIDYQVAKERSLKRATWNWNEKDLKEDLAEQNRLTDNFDTWFFDGVLTACSPIDSAWEGQI